MVTNYQQSFSEVSHFRGRHFRGFTVPSRVEVLEKMVVALDRWDINTKRNINYRSFEPILRLVKVIHTPQCQHWASWALANLTRTDGK